MEPRAVGNADIAKELLAVYARLSSIEDQLQAVRQQLADVIDLVLLEPGQQAQPSPMQPQKRYADVVRRSDERVIGNDNIRSVLQRHDETQRVPPPDKSFFVIDSLDQFVCRQILLLLDDESFPILTREQIKKRLPRQMPDGRRIQLTKGGLSACLYHLRDVAGEIDYREQNNAKLWYLRSVAGRAETDCLRWVQVRDGTGQRERRERK